MINSSFNSRIARAGGSRNDIDIGFRKAVRELICRDKFPPQIESCQEVSDIT